MNQFEYIYTLHKTKEVLTTNRNKVDQSCVIYIDLTTQIKKRYRKIQVHAVYKSMQEFVNKLNKVLKSSNLPITKKFGRIHYHVNYDGFNNQLLPLVIN